MGDINLDEQSVLHFLSVMLLCSFTTHVLFLNWEDPLEKGMANDFSILAWRILWTKKFGGLQSIGLQRVGTTERLTLSLS